MKKSGYISFGVDTLPVTNAHVMHYYGGAAPQHSRFPPIAVAGSPTIELRKKTSLFKEIPIDKIKKSNGFNLLKPLKRTKIQSSDIPTFNKRQKLAVSKLGSMCLVKKAMLQKTSFADVIQSPNFNRPIAPIGAQPNIQNLRPLINTHPIQRMPNARIGQLNPVRLPTRPTAANAKSLI